MKTASSSVGAKLSAAALAAALVCTTMFSVAQADERFVLQDADLVVQDKQTQLFWQRNGTRKAISFEAATLYCQSLQLGQTRKWRLPIIKELISLVDEAHYKPSIFPVFLTVSNLYWSSTVNVKRPSFSWTVNFSDGHVHAFRQTLIFSVRCVSNSPS